MTLAPSSEAQAANPWAAIIKAAIKKVVKAVDLMIQRRQNRVIRLQNAQKALENTMAKLKLERDRRLGQKAAGPLQGVL